MLGGNVVDLAGVIVDLPDFVTPSLCIADETRGGGGNTVNGVCGPRGALAFSVAFTKIFVVTLSNKFCAVLLATSTRSASRSM